ncbi:MAG TPA: hypothetical protein VH253_01270 [Phycisphaerae bacterium]|nr:hypothetical protein [Phycisphaerae bacterium]
MRKRVWYLIVGAAVAGVMAPVGRFLWMINSQTVARAEWEHGVVLPGSVRDLQCRGDANRLIGDRGASTVFDMDAGDLAGFEAGLPGRVGFRTFVPGNGEYRDFRFPWSGAGPSETFNCASATGDWLHVEVWPMGGGRVGVWIYTDWN